MQNGVLFTWSRSESVGAERRASTDSIGKPNPSGDFRLRVAGLQDGPKDHV